MLLFVFQIFVILQGQQCAHKHHTNIRNHHHDFAPHLSALCCSQRRCYICQGCQQLPETCPVSAACLLDHKERECKDICAAQIKGVDSQLFS